MNSDAPRRCDTNECDGDGSCFACNAISGEVCRKPMPRARRFEMPRGECAYCDTAGDHHPWHDASSRCESGSRSHCTCDVCF
jgi:hypothetical protein